MRLNYYIMVAIFLCISTAGEAQQRHNVDGAFFDRVSYKVAIGSKIGGSAPLPIPKEIRKVKGYSPHYPFFIGAKATHAIDSKWGVSLGLTFEGKGMNTKADVKNYKTSFNANEDPTANAKGYFTGRITTKVQNLYLSIPIQATYQVGERWSLQAGPYIAFALQKRFFGEATDGYLRNIEPTGEKLNITFAEYDFRESVRTIDVGMSLGTNYDFGQRYFALAQFDYGFNNIMKTGFESISFGLHNIFLNVGVGIKI
ncbi:porin family protein [Sphingobacterium sp. UT-1RO-CII-1]|uniref:porin family protein n=1 Tax=Sphingobacterium sp. UT-1RO-CII-1 TaxID=2995225 RepID=UPI00227D02DA|nr:porin family protein [Sphingobacterium sp. UT-1RO-CII-1]MCY4781395.1 porin family protein [Sphingobacterium sp. UT-1RO-CII-1]